MYLYIKDDQTVRRLSRIHLERCFMPNVGSYFEHGVEPALWFKVLVLDGVFVDCELGTRRVFWSSDRDNPGARHLHDVKNGLLTVTMVRDFFRKQEMIQEDELDPTFSELFDVASDIFTRLESHHDEQDATSNSTDVAYKLTVRLLHVYILPNVKLGPRQKSQVQECLDMINMEERDIETLITQHANTKQTNREILKSQRKDILNSGILTKTSQLVKLDIKFLEVFLHHVVEDVEFERKSIKKFEDQIKPLRNSRTSESKDKLEKLRLDRNAAHANFEIYLGTREEVQNFLNRRSQGQIKSNDVNETISFPEYSKRTELLQQLENDINQLMKRKLKVLTVRTSAEQTLKEIEEFGDSLGFSCSRGSQGFRAEIIPSNEGKPETWDTLKDRLASLLNNNRLHYGTAWRMFWLSQKRKLEAKLDLLEKASTCSDDDKETIVEVAECELICKGIKKHLEDMSVKMATELSGGVGVNGHQELVSKVFICYEQHVTVHLLQSVSELFARAYEKECTRLSEWIEERSDTMDFQNPGETLKLTKRIPMCCDIIKELKMSITFSDALKHITMLVKVIECSIHNPDDSQIEEGPCCDDLVDVVVQMLHKMKKNLLLALYSKIKILEILCPDFLSGSAHSYSLVTVSVAFQHLLNQAALDSRVTDC